ncbi:VWA domain-containing protein [Streptomyces sp. NPDC003635]
MGILTLLRNAFGRGRKGRTPEAEGADTTPRAEVTTTPEAQTDRPQVPEPRQSTDSEHELVSAAFDNVTVPKQSEPDPVTEEKTEPVAKAEAEPVAKAEAEPVAEAEAEPVAEAEAEPIVEAEVEPVAKAKAEPVAKAEAEPVVEAEPVAEAEAEPVAKAEAEPVVEAEPVTKAEAEPVAKTEAEPIVEAEVEPVAKAKAEPVAKAEAEPVSESESALEEKAEPDSEPEPVAEAEPEPVAAVEAEPVVEPEAEPVVEAETAPEAAAEPAAEPVVEEPEPVVAAESEPVAEAEPVVEPEPVTEEPAAADGEDAPQVAAAADDEDAAPASPEPAASDGEDAPQVAAAADHESGTGGAGGSDSAEGEADTDTDADAETRTPATTLARLKSRAPGLATAYRAAAGPLKKNNLTGTRAKTYLVLDRSASMRPYYKDGSAQALAEQTLALAAHLDDDATVHVTFFSTELDGTTELTLTDHENKIDDTHASLGRMGRTSYHVAVEEVVTQHHKNTPAGTPALVIFQTDGAPDAKTPATQALTDAAKNHPNIHFAFVAFGEHDNKAFDYLRKLKTDNTSFFHAGPTPRELTDTELYTGVLENWRP